MRKTTISGVTGCTQRQLQGPVNNVSPRSRAVIMRRSIHQGYPLTMVCFAFLHGGDDVLVADNVYLCCRQQHPPVRALGWRLVHGMVSNLQEKNR
jgi:hypothetical protein